MKPGDIVDVMDGSYHLIGLTPNAMAHTSGSIKGRRWRVMAVDCDVPGKKSCLDARERNDMVCREVAAPEHILFTRAAFCKLVSRPEKDEPKPCSGPCACWPQSSKTCPLVCPLYPQPTDAERYLAGHKACGIEVGNWVEVTRVPTEEDTKGWRFGWVRELEATIGTVCKVFYVNNDSGCIQLNDDKGSGRMYPYTVLRVVPAPEPEVVWYARDWADGGELKRITMYHYKPQTTGSGRTWLADGWIEAYISLCNFQRRYGFTPDYGSCGSMLRSHYEEHKDD